MGLYMKIAICDDEKECRDSIAAILNDCSNEFINITTTMFIDGLDLVAAYNEQQCFDIVLLDVEMPGLDGLQTGKAIRKLDKDVIIVFLTSHKQYVFDSLCIEVFDYLIKPPNIKSVRNLLERAHRKYCEQHYVVHFRYEGVSYSLEVTDIVYIEGYNRHIYFNTANVVYKCIGKLNDYDKILTPYGFLRCHQGYLINMKYISSMDNGKIYTTTNKWVEMSFRKKQECLRAYNRYLTRYRV